MLNNYLKIAFRHLWNNKVFTLINLIGLAISLSAGIVIFLITSYHFSFDTFHPDKDLIYRVVTDLKIGDKELNLTGVPEPLYETVKRDFSGIDEVVAFKISQTPMSIDDTKNVSLMEEEQTIYIDSSFFNFFKYQWLTGSKESSRQPNSIVLNESLAEKYFGELGYDQILGKVIYSQGDIPLTVSGIVANFSEPSDFNFNAFITSSTFGKRKKWRDIGSQFQLFMKINPKTSPRLVEDQLVKVYNDNINANAPFKRVTQLQPLGDIHFNTKYLNFEKKPAHKPSLLALQIVALLLLILGAINYINLTTADRSKKSREVSIRKYLGSPNRQLITQMLVESLIMVCLALIFAFFLMPLLFVLFKDFTPPSISVELLTNNGFISFLLVVVILLTVVAGLLPAKTLVRTGSVDLMKSNWLSKKGNTGRSGLTVLQFTISLTLLIMTVFIIKQTRFSLNQDLGFNKNSIINFRPPYTSSWKQNESLLEQFKLIPHVVEASLAGQSLTDRGRSTVISMKREGAVYEAGVEFFEGDSSFMHLYGLKLIAGDYPKSSEDKYLVNRKLTEVFGFESPNDAIGYQLQDPSGSHKIITGVIEDFRMESTHSEIKPIIIDPHSHEYAYYHVKLPSDAAGVKQGLQEIERIWKQVFVDDLFEYEFVEDKVAALYETELKISNLLSWASGITILISCLGLLGLAIFRTNQKIKEIGIRKVNGAKVSEILALINKDFIKWVVLSFAIASPIAWYAVDFWLTNFAYRTEISWWIFVLAGLSTMTVALLTVSWQSWKAATRNPVETLRYE